MIQKLLKYLNDEIPTDDVDTIMNHEAVPPGRVYLSYMKSRIQTHMHTLREKILKDARTSDFSFMETESVAKYLGITGIQNVGQAMGSFIATGKIDTGKLLVSDRLELPQYLGWSVVAERLNFFRFVSHFRALHRGQVFTTMKTTAVRKLKSDQWGFVCPVHTPDGSPCGLLNHLSNTCRVTAGTVTNEQIEQVVKTLFAMGMSPATRFTDKMAPVLLDGRIIGSLPYDEIQSFADKLRYKKVHNLDDIPSHIEISPVAYRPKVYLAIPSLLLNLSQNRLLRPLLHLASNKVEMVGTSEQLFLNIACREQDLKQRKNVTHMETDPTAILSFVANLTPFCDFNQSPRNVYQCQMGKQTMGFPMFSLNHRTDNKIYRIQTPQKPLVRTRYQEALPFNDYLTGTNAVVAVLSYTGFDMEDAMIVNKSTFERGFGHASVYKSECIDLNESQDDGEKCYFEGGKKPLKHVDEDGLPKIGATLLTDEAYVTYYNGVVQEHKSVHFESYSERAHVQNVILTGSELNGVRKVQITHRINRNPVIGDKFSSRHGQKGVMSTLWHQEDLPFTEEGITPDVIINPHAFPSRMTIGMLIECMAGKAGAVHGHFADATAFQFDAKDRAVDFFGEQLKAAGYNYYGNQTMYSGALGVEFKAEIFIGVVYYQRLRHMVKDKFQVRSTGPVDKFTHQPIHGRTKGGGVRFGEMERDALLSHGAAFVLRDRLFTCSDKDFVHVCNKCGSMVSVYKAEETLKCRLCKSEKQIDVVEMPHIFKVLANEFAALNIRLTLKLEQ